MAYSVFGSQKRKPRNRRIVSLMVTASCWEILKSYSARRRKTNFKLRSLKLTDKQKNICMCFLQYKSYGYAIFGNRWNFLHHRQKGEFCLVWWKPKLYLFRKYAYLCENCYAFINQAILLNWHRKLLYKQWTVEHNRNYTANCGLLFIEKFTARARISV